MQKTSIFPLVPLRITTGWKVTFNNFTERIPELSPDGEFLNSRYFAEDLLQLKYNIPGPGDFELLLDLGWSPVEKYPGKYRLTLTKANDATYQNLKEIELDTWQEVQQTIGEWLEYDNYIHLI